MKKLTLVILLLTIITAGYAQVNITTDGTTEPTVTVSAPSAIIADIAVKSIKARTATTIMLNDTEFTVTYEGSTYKVYQASKPEDSLFESTRVADVRVFLKAHLKKLMDNL